MQNVSVYKGDSRALIFTVKDGDGVAVDLTGLTGSNITFDIVGRRSKTSLVALTLSSGIALSDATNGQYTVTLTTSHTSNNPGSHYYETEVVISGETYKVAFGTIDIIPPALG